MSKTFPLTSTLTYGILSLGKDWRQDVKRFIRTLQTRDESEQIRMRQYLNDLGFYVLTLPCNRLEINVIEEHTSIMSKLLTVIRGML